MSACSGEGGEGGEAGEVGEAGGGAASECVVKGVEMEREKAARAAARVP